MTDPSAPLSTFEVRSNPRALIDLLREQNQRDRCRLPPKKDGEIYGLTGGGRKEVTIRDPTRFLRSGSIRSRCEYVRKRPRADWTFGRAGEGKEGSLLDPVEQKGQSLEEGDAKGTVAARATRHLNLVVFTRGCFLASKSNTPRTDKKTTPSNDRHTSSPAQTTLVPATSDVLVSRAAPASPLSTGRYSSVSIVPEEEGWREKGKQEGEGGEARTSEMDRRR